jgi:hypothetical protein
MDFGTNDRPGIFSCSPGRNSIQSSRNGFKRTEAAKIGGIGTFRSFRIWDAV